jgi:hypothetical protein
MRLFPRLPCEIGALAASPRDILIAPIRNPVRGDIQ